MQPISFFGRVRGILPWIAAGLALAATWVWVERLLPGGGLDGLSSVPVLLLEQCDPGQQTCRLELADGHSVTLTLTPQPLRPLVSSQAKVHLSGHDPQWVEVDFAGVEMSMGFNRFRLERLSAGQYAGEMMLPVCARETMTWQVTILPEGETASAVARFATVTRR